MISSAYQHERASEGSNPAAVDGPSASENAYFDSLHPQDESLYPEDEFELGEGGALDEPVEQNVESTQVDDVESTQVDYCGQTRDDVIQMGINLYGGEYKGTNNLVLWEQGKLIRS